MINDNNNGIMLFGNWNSMKLKLFLIESLFL